MGVDKVLSTSAHTIVKEQPDFVRPQLATHVENALPAPRGISRHILVGDQVR